MSETFPGAKAEPTLIQNWVVRVVRWYLLHPLTVSGVMAIIGILLAEYWHPHVDGFVVAGVVSSLLLAIWLRTRWSLSLLCLTVFMLLHARQIQSTFQHPLRQRLLAMGSGSVGVKVQARLYPWPDGVGLNESRALADVQALSWSQTESMEPMKTRLRVTLPARFKLTSAGVYELVGNLSLPPQPMNPGQFDMQTYGLRRGWVADLQAVTVTMVASDAWSPRFHLLRWAEVSRRWISEALAQGIEGQKREMGVLLAMALGVSDAAGEEVEEAFRGSGTLHIFAISGLHVVMLAGVMGFLLRWTGFGAARSVIYLIILVFCYAYITGWQPSAARAALMIGILLAAPWWNRKAMIQNSLGAALLLLLALNTQQLFTPGFQLSFAVLWAISLVASPLIKLFDPWTSLDPFLPPQLASPMTRWLSSIRQGCASLVSVSLAAWLGSLPFMLGHFQTLTPVGLFANLILVPASGISMSISCASLVFSLFGFSTMQVLANLLNAKVAYGMIALTAWFASWPLANFTLDLRFEKNPAAVEIQVFHLPPAGMAHHLRVGHQHWLLDTGDDRSWRNVVRPSLRQLGVDHLDGIILSHSDVRHVGAADQAAQMGWPRLHSSINEPYRYDPPFSSLRLLSKVIPVDSFRWHRHVMGDEIQVPSGASLPTAIQVLYPMEQDQYTRADDRGLALLLQAGPTRVLWLADAGPITINAILQRHPGLLADVIIHSPNGADSPPLETLLAAVKSKLLIHSQAPLLSGESTPEKFAGRSLNLYECGGINLRFDSSGVDVRTFLMKLSFRIQTAVE